MSDRYHRAAKDGLLGVLKETTKKDTNLKDEDGMTPTLWAAFEGNLEALKLLVGRGGNPEKCDNYGNRALHLAAAKGHLQCVSYLINFGVNMYGLDIDMHTPQELAAMNDCTEILQYFDAVHTKAEAEDPKRVKKLQEQAQRDTLKLKKNFQKVQDKADKMATKHKSTIEKSMKKMASQEEADEGAPIVDNRRDSVAVHQQHLNFSEMVGVSGGDTTGTTRSKKLMGTVFKKANVKKRGIQADTFKVRSTQGDGSKTMTRLSGLRRDSEIMFVSPIKENDDEVDVPAPRLALRRDTFGIFERPGFGEMAFRRESMAATLMAVSNDVGSDGERASSRHSREDPSDGSDEEPSDGAVDDAISLFLAGLGLSSYISVFQKQKIDLETLMELNEQNLMEMDMEIGPRKKILKAIKERQDDMAKVTIIEDSSL
ncbi:hypothetical protein TCAL_00067 [Tigriopus californicus]|uniref:NAD(+) ADP-ribosyltransferase n=1 Tax=Tigriopus californicus TaxID=6832 RepID=A0A553PHI8_TIGCA|nr:pre-mRNA splicing regulator USH1G-like [Tigriopus californicus]TRY77153.1 hypothetical protein TCAL_00067 [Tigriopus californicus]|eukprot:TCALIF_00067-PA protein Name:"Similar to Ush1g Usher syndrome type-1G protein homolog (Mus musculus)" AED:0.00 eAED:0.00 QI:428/1/1/1/1/1/2/75/427